MGELLFFFFFSSFIFDAFIVNYVQLCASVRSFGVIMLLEGLDKRKMVPKITDLHTSQLLCLGEFSITLKVL